LAVLKFFKVLWFQPHTFVIDWYDDLQWLCEWMASIFSNFNSNNNKTLTLKSRGSIFWYRKEADHKNRDYEPSGCSYYISKELSCSSSRVIEYPLEEIFDLIEESKEKKFDLKFCP
jgi:hypothetical protein